MNDLKTEKGIHLIRTQLAELLAETVNRSLSALTLEMDKEIITELKERIAALVFNEQINDSQAVHYLAVWEEGCKEIAHLYMSPKIMELSGYSAEATRPKNGTSPNIGKSIPRCLARCRKRPRTG